MQTVKIIPNPFHNNGRFVAMIVSGKYANRSYIADGHNSYGSWATAEAARARAIELGYSIAE